MSMSVLRRPGTGRGLRSTTQLLDINAELGVATAKVDLGEVSDATVQVGAAASLAANALIGRVFAERLLGWDITPTRTNLDVAIRDQNPVVVRVSLDTEPSRVLAALRSNQPSNLDIDVVVLDDSFAEWARGRMEWTISQRRCAEWPINSP
jgi:hypothetical protein